MGPERMTDEQLASEMSAVRARKALAMVMVVIGTLLTGICALLSAAIPAVLFAILAGVGLHLRTKAAESGRQLTGGQLAAGLLEEMFDDAQYDAQRAISFHTVAGAAIPLPTFNGGEGSDYASASYHGMRFEMSNVHLTTEQVNRDEETNMETTSVTSSWRGFWLIAELDRTLPCDLRIIPRGALEKLIRTRGVRTGDEAFDKGYIVFSDNEEEVLRVLTPHMREALVRLLELLGKNGGISFRVEGKVHLAAGGRQLFVPDRGITDVAMTRMKFAKELHWVTTLLDEVGQLRTLYGRG